LFLASLSSLVKCLRVMLRAYPKEDLLLGAPLEKAPPFLTNNRLGWKDLPVTNTPVYYEYS